MRISTTTGRLRALWLAARPSQVALVYALGAGMALATTATVS